jgi:hypothetical protein
MARFGLLCYPKSPVFEPRQFLPPNNLSPDPVTGSESLPYSENLVKDLSPLSPLSPLESKTLTESDFTKGDKKGDKGDKFIPFQESPSLEPGDFVMHRGKSYAVAAITGDVATLLDWRTESAEPISVPLSEVDADDRSPKQRAKQGGVA